MSAADTSNAPMIQNSARNEQKDLSADWTITQDLWGAAKAQALVAGVELDVFSAIHGGHSMCAQVAQAVGAREDSMRRLLDALVACGYLYKNGNDYSVDTAAVEFLVRGQPHYMGAAVKRLRSHWESWGQLTEVVKRGYPYHKVNQVEEGGAFFAEHVQAIFPSNLHAAEQLVRGLPQEILSRVGRILDIGCGAGAWSIAFAGTLPKARITALDFPQVISIAKIYAARFGVDLQFEFIEADLHTVDFAEQAYDLVCLGYVLHNEGIQRGRDLIRRGFDALRPGGWLLIADIAANDDRVGPLIPVLFGLNMLVLTEHGNVFTEAEMKDALHIAGFEKIQRLTSPAPSLFLLAKK